MPLHYTGRGQSDSQRPAPLSDKDEFFSRETIATFGTGLNIIVGIIIPSGTSDQSWRKKKRIYVFG
ncbi:hypothetical protein PGT21_001569 [Puccinia graminis f. sp. tritici]|uniref:Uncharacterized protein n=1 Tax=Puccinia graminis f. sp. tritici TaxID=56615 RepID=A0A5B0LJ66_PUCGR|nr:hypothetical protein PGT21_001569 [Puccinia graminis f. sp. tritici]